ncbi:MAG TPA: mycothiol system anti-sigma-R factor [Actinomycetota bacterium]|nr:mycothiol system anti-sigma-R factor [Actinomycetota bacterium]
MKEHCREILATAYLFLDGEGLSHAERIEIEAHLEECAPCLERFDLQTEVRSIVYRIGGSTPCPEALKNRIANLLEQA